MNNFSQIKNMVKLFSGQDRTVTIPAVYIDLTGDYVTAALLNQIVFWSDKTKRKDGFFYKTYGEWNEELFLTERQVRYATNKLKEMGLVTTKLKKADGAPTLHYQIDMDKLVASILTKCQNGNLQSVRMETDSMSESLTEITTEITTSNSTTAEDPILTREEKEVQLLKSKNAIRFIEENLAIRLSPIDYQSIGYYSDDFSGREEIINYAATIASDRNAKTWGFIKRLLNEWLDQKCMTLEDVMKYEKAKYAKNKSAAPKKSSKQNSADVFKMMREQQGAK